MPRIACWPRCRRRRPPRSARSASADRSSPGLAARRSGERRGGEEGRSRWWPDHLKKKNETYPVDRFQVLEHLRIFIDFLPHAPNVDIHGSGLCKAIVSTQLIDQQIAGNNRSCLVDTE